jgi:hypothetical protein
MSENLTLNAERIHEISKNVAKRLEDLPNGERKMKSILCETHERRMRPDRKRTSGEYQIQIVPGDGVYLDLFTTCAHSKNPCNGRASIAVARFTDAGIVVTNIDNLDIEAR